MILLLAGEMDYLLARSLGYTNADTFTAGEAALPDLHLIRDWVGQRVVIFYDNDPAGRTGAGRLAECLASYGCQPSIVRYPPGIPEGHDFTDLVVAHGYQREHLDMLIQQAPAWEPPTVEGPLVEAKVAPERYARTDTRNAERLAELHGDDLRYCKKLVNWYAWDGTRWRPDDTEEVMRRAKATAVTIFANAVQRNDESLAKHATSSLNNSRIQAMVTLARSDARIAVLPEVFDPDPWALNVQNGTINLRTGTLCAHDRAGYHTKIAGAALRADAQCPQWHTFLRQIMGGDTGMVDYLQRITGYAMTGDVSEQVLFYLYGTGQNGKSVFINTIMAVLGDYAKAGANNLLTVKRNESHPTELADLCGIRFVAVAETNRGQSMDEALVKQLTGGDRRKARFMRQDWFEFQPTDKLFVYANYKLAIQGTDTGIWRRQCLVPFTVTIPDEQRDPHLSQKLLEERDGILAWMLAGCLEWQRRGLDTPTAVRDATADYRAEQDVIALFLRERATLDPQVSVNKVALWHAFDEWRSDSAEQPISQRDFASRLKDRGFKEGRDKTGRFIWQGITLNP